MTSFFKIIPILTLIIFSFHFSFAQKERDAKAEKIIADCIQAHGGKNYTKLDISFDFRQFRFRIKNDKKGYLYERTYKDSTGNMLHDILENGVFLHEINNVTTKLNEKMESRYREGLNSVAYFMLLPYKLRDKAVNAKYLEDAEIDGKKYHKIKVWFDAEGGGKDHEDIYCFWINQDSHLMDYLAYANGGPRFRKVTNRELVSSTIFQNYENYQILDKEIPTHQYDNAYKEGKYKLLSKIEQSNYRINK